MCLCQCKSRGGLTLTPLGSSQPLAGEAGACCTGRSVTPPWAVRGRKCCCKHHGPEGLPGRCTGLRVSNLGAHELSLQQETRPWARTTTQP